MTQNAYSSQKNLCYFSDYSSITALVAKRQLAFAAHLLASVASNDVQIGYKYDIYFVKMHDRKCSRKDEKN
jgi:hypothetical protein